MRHQRPRALGLAAGLAAAIGIAFAQAAPAAAAPQATVTCGRACTDLTMAVSGPGELLNAAVPGDTGTGGASGQPVTMALASQSSPNEDFGGGFAGTVRDFCRAWPAPQSFSPQSWLCQRYPTLPVFQLSWAPFGRTSGLCAGVGAPAPGAAVTLQPCGASDATLWVGDRPHGAGHDCRSVRRYCPWLNAASPDFLRPLALTVSRFPGRLSLQTEQVLTGDAAADSQQVNLHPGPYAPAS